jgi:hypothetical protein
MRKIVIILILACAGFGQVQSQILNVSAVTQEQTEWCWAGVSACMLNYYCSPTPQCTIAEYTRTVATWHSFGTTPCCTNPNVGCNYWNYNWGENGSIQDILQHFANITNYGVGSTLSQATITSDLGLNRLFVIRWGWSGGGGHFVVGHGQSGSNLYYMDPWFGEGMKVGTYAWVCSGSNHTWTHTNRLSISPVSGAPANAGTITGLSTVCQGQNSVVYSVPSIANATSYVWTLPTGASGSSTTTSITVNFGSSAVSGNITVKGHNSCGDGVASSKSITVNTLPAQPGAMSGLTTICGQTVNTYSVASVSGATSYIWTLPSGWSGSSITNTINAVASNTSGTVTCKAVNACGSGTTRTLSVTVSPVPNAPTSISGSTTVCQGSNQTYSLVSIPGATSYSWSFPAGWTGTSTTNSINVTVGSASGSITLLAMNACGASIPGTFPVTVNPLPTPPSTIVGNPDPCSGVATTYNIPAISGITSYTWTKPSGWTGGSVSNTLNVIAGTTSGAITVNTNNSCGASASPQSLSVNPVLPSTGPVSAIADPAVIPPGGSSHLSCNPPAPHGYTAKWYVGSCTGALAGTGDTIVVTPSAATSYYVRYEGSCGNTNCVSTSVSIGTGSTLIIPCPLGFTWFSINQDRGSWNINTVLGTMTSQGGLTHPPSQNDMIIGQSSFATYYGSSWVGSLTTLNPQKMYIAKFTGADTIIVNGNPVSYGPVALPQGFTWFGYLPQCNENTNVALGGMMPTPAQNDKIIAQTSFATYYGSSWVGSLTSMYPSKGYKSSLSSSSSFTYPSCAKFAQPACSELFLEEPEWTLSDNMLYTMTIIARVKDVKGNFLSDKACQLGSFSGYSCRGITQQPDCMDGHFFVSVASNDASGEMIHFKIKLGEQVYDIVEKLPYKEGQCLGSVESPVIFTLPSNISLPGSSDEFSLGNAVPNPFTNETILYYNLPEEAVVNLNIYSVTGQVLRNVNIGSQALGPKQVIITAMEEGGGVYICELEVRFAGQFFRATKRIIQLW